MATDTGTDSGGSVEMSAGPYYVRNADNRYYRRGQHGQARWVDFLRDASEFVNFETAEETAAEQSTPGNECKIVAAREQQIPLL
jgi:hypothetical protein